MKNIRLFKSGSIGEALEGSSDKQIDRKALLVYAGKFDSMDGEVEVTPEHIQNLAKNHNESFTRLSKSASDAKVDVPMKFCPPVQVDHSTSGWDTVGRLIGPTEVGEHDGNVALFGTLRFLGSDAVERVSDGRWTHLSLGADLDEGKLNEMTVTPFPAAPNASLLSKNQNPKGEAMDEKKEKLKKHLMEKEKLSEKEAEDKMSKMSEEEMSKLSTEITDPPAMDKKDQDPPKAKMTKDQKKKFTELTKGFREGAVKMAHENKKVQLAGRITKLRADRKITPAEEKQFDLDKMAKLPKESIDVMFEIFEKRQPVVLMGTYGTTRGESITTLANDVKEKKMLGEMMEGMRFSKDMVKRLAGGDPGKPMPTSMDGKPMQMSSDDPGRPMPTSMDNVMDMSSGEMHEKLCHMKHLMESGQHEAAKAHLEGMITEHEKKMKEPGTTEGSYAGMPEGSLSHLSALAQNVEKLQNQFEALVELTSPLLTDDEDEE